MRYQIPQNLLAQMQSQIANNVQRVPGVQGKRQALDPNTGLPKGPVFQTTTPAAVSLPEVDPGTATVVPPAFPVPAAIIPGFPGKTQPLDPRTGLPKGPVVAGPPPPQSPWIPDPQPPPPTPPPLPAGWVPGIPGKTQPLDPATGLPIGPVVSGPPPAAPPPAPVSPPSQGKRQALDPVTLEPIGPVFQTTPTSAEPSGDDPDSVGQPTVTASGQLQGLPWEPERTLFEFAPDFLGHVITDPMVLNEEYAMVNGLPSPVPEVKWISDIMRVNT